MYTLDMTSYKIMLEYDTRNKIQSHTPGGCVSNDMRGGGVWNISGGGGT
jgi:hypothetical protein